VHITTEPMDIDGVLAAAREDGAVPEARWNGLPGGTVVGHVHFTVSDLEPATAFYRDVVGFDVTVRLPLPRPSLVGVAAGGYHHHLNLNTWAGEGAPPDSERVAGLDAWELVVPDAAARRALADRLARSGANRPSTSGNLSASDPDGIRLEVVGDAPPADAVSATGHRAEPGRMGGS
jgi:catechol 2,3-dioxygenase